MHPRHGTLWRVAAAMALALAVCAAHAARRPDSRTPHERTIDSLFYAGRYDSLSRWIPDLVRAAEARGDSALLGRLSFQRGRVEITLGHQAIASRELDRAIRLTEAARDTVGLLPALGFKAFVLRDQGNYDPAMALFERQRDLAHRAGVPASEGNATFNLAYRDLKRGNLELARAGYTRAAELFRLSGDPYQIAIGTNALGNLYRTLGDVDSSRIWFRETLRIARAHKYPFHELWALNNLGLLENDCGNFELSMECYKSALAIGRRIGFDRGTALPAMNLALAHSEMGERDRAFEYLDECLAVCKRAGFRDMEEVVTNATGLLNVRSGRSNRAAAAFRSVLQKDFIFETMRRADAAWGLALALAQMDSVGAAIRVLEPYVVPNVKVPNHMEQPFFELTYVELLRRDHRCRDALDRIDALREELDRTGRTNLSVTARLLESSCRREIGEPSLAAGALTIALDSLEVARNEIGRAEFREAFGMQMMNEVVEGCRVALEYPPGLPWAEHVRRFYDSLQRFKTRTLLERIRDPRGDESPPATDALSHPMNAAQIQADVLRPRELLLDIVVSTEQSYLFAVSADSCRLVPLPGWRSRLPEQVGLYADLLAASSSQMRNTYPPARLAETQRALGKVVLDPVADLIAQADRIIVAPDGFYASVPFGTLIVENGRMLLEEKEVVEVPSASVLAWSRAAVAGGPTASSLLAVTEDSRGQLSGAEREVDSLRRRYAAVEVATPGPGVIDTLVRHAQPDRILHIAAHARMNDASPWQSGFTLGTSDSLADGTPAGESLLRAWQIARSNLPYGMAVLAGCETAGRATNGEGVLGLTSAFLSAGVPVIVSSRWPVDDRATAVLMEHFYDRLAAGETVAAALRGAQMAVRADRHTSHPFYWAGFAVVGDGTRVIAPVLAAGGRNLWLAAIAGVAVAMGLAGWNWHRRRPAARGSSVA